MDLVQDTRKYLFSEISLVFMNETNVFFSVVFYLRVFLII